MKFERINTQGEFDLTYVWVIGSGIKIVIKPKELFPIMLPDSSIIIDEDLECLVLFKHFFLENLNDVLTATSHYFLVDVYEEYASFVVFRKIDKDFLSAELWTIIGYFDINDVADLRAISINELSKRATHKSASVNLMTDEIQNLKSSFLSIINTSIEGIVHRRKSQ